MPNPARRRFPSGRGLSLALAMLVITGTITPLVDEAGAATTVTQTFSYSASTQSFTVPDGVSSLTVTLSGGQGGKGGHDSQGTPTPGGYQGVVTGTIDVTAGQVLTIAVGGGGTSGVTGGGVAGGAGGLNPMTGYDGSIGGTSGPAGGSGSGGGGGAATVLRVGGVDIVAGGAGGGGGSGQFLPIVGRRAEENHTARPDAVSTTGRPGMNTALACSPGFSCDGGASGSGGGGAQGGDRGDVQYGGASATEYFGFGGFPGSNSTAGFDGLTSSFSYFAGNNANGSIVISYDNGTPGTPTSVSATPQPTAIALTWAAPTSEGQAAITDYVVQYATSVGGPYTTFADGTSTSRSATVTGLTNGTTYYFRIAAVNSYGAGGYSTPTPGLAPSDVPSAPTLTTLTPFDSGLYADLTPGATNSPILNYEYRLDGTGPWYEAQAVSNRITIPGLTNGQAYGVRIRAVNIIGAGATSGSLTGTPRAVPSAPIAPQVTAGNTTASLTWTAPSSVNGSAISDYVVQYATSAGGSYSTFSDGTSTATSATVTGLTNGTAYYFRVAAVNGAGTGATTVPIGTTPYTLPGTPSISTVTPGDGKLIVDFTLASNGGSSVTAYEYQLDGAGAWLSTGSLTGQFAITGLTNGIAHTVSVRAANVAGTGSASAASAGTPRTVPGAPAISAVALDTGAVGVSFTVGDDGGSAITNFQYSIDGGTNWITRSPASTVSPITIAGLTGGQTYQVALRAVNASGVSSASNTSSVTAKGTPFAPTVSRIVEGDRALSIEVTAPANGGSPITNYEYSTNNGTSWVTLSPSSISSPIVVGGLTNGTAYDVRVRAVNAAGSGTASVSTAATPRTTPSAPTITADTIAAVDGGLDVFFTAPSSNGGATLTTYEYSTDAGATWRTRAAGSTSSPLRITAQSSNGTSPLTGGTTYPVEIRAVNSAGAGAASAVANGIVTSVPAAPTFSSVTPQDSSAAVTFAIPANGGSAITAYEYRLDGGSWVNTDSLSNRFVIGGLTNSTTYMVEMRAINGVGNSAVSASRSVTVSTIPGAPSLDGVASGDRILTASFTPGTTGGGTITGYEYSTDGGLTWRTRAAGTTSSPIVITTESGSGAVLTNGTIYSVQVRAVNAAGGGAASVSNLVAPRGAPSVPSGVTLTPGDTRLTVSFAPGADGGSSITGYEYRVDGGPWVDTGSLSSPFAITALTNGTAYGVEIRAINALGAGPSSTLLTGVPRTVPGTPTSLAATVADRSTTATWAAPSSTGGAAVTSYVVLLYSTPNGGTTLGSCTTSTLTCEITGLTNGTTGYLSVVAVNAAGSGTPTGPRLVVTPQAAPRVSIGSLAPGTNEVVVTATIDDGGGSPISNYQYRLDGGSWQSVGSSTNPFTISGLSTGTPYSVEIRAVNALGAGPASAPVSATPRTRPGVPSSLVATRGPASVALSWVAPLADGGAPVTDYVIQYATSAAGPFTTFTDGTSTATSATVTGLTNGTEYVFRVAAANGAGAGTNSALVNATPLAGPSAPTITTITPGSRFLQVAFTAPSVNGGAAVTGYEYQLDGGVWRTAVATTSPLMIPGLTNGHAYQVAIRGVNAAGGGTTSNAVTATPFGLPSAVPGFLASPGSGSVSLTWDAADANGSVITAYNIIRWSARTEGGISQSFSTTNTSYNVTGLGNGTYYFTIEATNASGTGPRSAPRTVAIVGGTVAGAPTINTVSVNADSAALAWTAGSVGTSAASGYVIQYVTDSSSSTLALSSTAGTSATVTLPSATTPYSLKVATISDAGVGTFATVRPSLTAGAAATSVAATSATLNATVNANGTTVTPSFRYSTSSAAISSGGGTVGVASPSSATGSSATPVTSTLTGLAPATTYYARASATAGGVVSYGDVRSFTTPVDITSSDLAPTYTGSPLSIGTVTNPAGVNVVRTYVGTGGTTYPSSTTAPIDAGTYQVTTVVSDGALTGTRTDTLTIAPKPLTVAINAADKLYDGTRAADLTVDVTGIVTGDDVVVDPTKASGQFATAGVGTGKTVDLVVDAAFFTGSDVANYTATIPATTTASIVKADQTVSFTSAVPSPATVGDTYTPTAVSTMGLTPVITRADATSAVCSISSGVVTFVEPGTCVLVASQDGSADVNAATPAAQVISVTLVPVTTTTTTTTTAVPTTAAPTTAPATTAAPTTVPRTTVPISPDDIFGPGARRRGTTARPETDAPLTAAERRAAEAEAAAEAAAAEEAVPDELAAIDAALTPEERKAAVEAAERKRAREAAIAAGEDPDAASGGSGSSGSADGSAAGDGDESASGTAVSADAATRGGGGSGDASAVFWLCGALLGVAGPMFFLGRRRRRDEA